LIVIINQAYLPHFAHNHMTTVTENDELSAARVGDVSISATSFSAEIDSSVSELNWTGVEVTCDVRSVVLLGNTKSRWNSVGETVAGVDDVGYTRDDLLGSRHTQTVEPLYG